VPTIVPSDPTTCPEIGLDRVFGRVLAIDRRLEHLGAQQRGDPRGLSDRHGEGCRSFGTVDAGASAPPKKGRGVCWVGVTVSVIGRQDGQVIVVSRRRGSRSGTDIESRRSSRWPRPLVSDCAAASVPAGTPGLAASGRVGVRIMWIGASSVLPSIDTSILAIAPQSRPPAARTKVLRATSPWTARRVHAPARSAGRLFGTLPPHRRLSSETSGVDARMPSGVAGLRKRGGDGGNRTRVRGRADDGFYERSRRSDLAPD
jgi:hypothetical protein